MQPFANESNTSDPREELITQQLTESGYSLKIPDRLLERNLAAKLPGKNRDHILQIPIQDEEIRNLTIDELTKAVKDNKPFMYLHIDADNLKFANKLTPGGRRWLGDLAIKWSATHTLNVLNEILPEDSQARLIIVRPTNAADELSVWVFTENEEDLDRGYELISKIDDTVEIKNPKFTFSTSYSSITSKNRLIGDDLNYVGNQLRAGGLQRAATLFNTITNVADDIAHFNKTVKEFTGLPTIEELVKMGITDMIHLLRVKFADRRIGGKAYELHQQMTAILSHFQGVLDFYNQLKPEDKEKYQAVLDNYRSRIRGLTNKGILSVNSIFEEIFGRSKENKVI